MTGYEYETDNTQSSGAQVITIILGCSVLPIGWKDISDNTNRIIPLQQLPETEAVMH